MQTCPYTKQLTSSVYRLAQLAFAEDIPETDVTAVTLGLRGTHAQAEVIIRQSGTMVGSVWYLEVLRAYCEKIEAEIQVSPQFSDGDRLKAGDVLFRIEGDRADIVGFERTFLNFLGRGIGIAIKTRAFVDLVRSTGAPTEVLDTRKTLPGFRYFDKYAVLCGGGSNHRMNLSDQILIKENHVASFGSIEKTLMYARERAPAGVPIEIEVTTLDQLRDALDAGCNLIMLDNFSPQWVQEACSWDRQTAQLEVSGGINLQNITSYCHRNLDRISVGSLTHSVIAPDLTLLIQED